MKTLMRCFAVLLAVLVLCAAPAFAQSEPDADHWGAKYEGLPGQPAHGLALEHMPDFQPGMLDSSLPGQPGHAPPVQVPPGYQPEPLPSSPLTSEPVSTPAPMPQSMPVSPPPSPSPVSQNVTDVMPVQEAAVQPREETLSPSRFYPIASPPEDTNTQPASAPGFRRDAPLAPPDNMSAQSQYKPVAKEPTYMDLATRSGFDIGVQDYFDRYMEPDDPSVVSSGNMAGLTASATATFGRGYFATADARYAFGNVDYRGSGSQNGEPNDLWEGRLVIGRDFIFPEDPEHGTMHAFSLSPYAGLGYRYLYNNAQGVTSTGAHGYRRENQLYYLPIGVKPRFPIDMDSRLTSTLETDVLLWGQQTSFLTDAGNSDPTLINRQSFGIGVKADMMYETEWWSIGPFVNFWAIDKSQEKLFTSINASCGGTLCVGYEPQNYTFEAGIQAKFHFYGPLLRFN